MSLLKEKIIGSAMQIFSQKGYAATSIQDIANDCGIAKGSLYKFFASKEDLLVEVYRHRTQAMFEESNRIKSDPALSPRERFVLQTHRQFEFFLEFKYSIKDFYELPMNEDGVFSKFLKQMRSQMLINFAELMISVYGPEVEKNKWDLIALYSGILKEYMIMTTLISSPFNYDRMANFVVDRMDEMAAGIKKSIQEPILDADVMTQFVASGMRGCHVPAGEQLHATLSKLMATIQELQVTNARRAELHEAAHLLQEEAADERPRMVLVRALIGLLQSQHELVATASQLERLYESKRAKLLT
ncbi:TetR/AcrR family transcriptional regulator [Paenibacillus sp. OV219]|uniref:TetR/AcrR family transcriptional regulator n=1 Tax=Paenibacillus sp. OV219 TaxID=1884377 RepID=UPI0008ADE90C|nr:TetR/AcrR family transcriptional regulator [Paenibacillus sp. OV219]SEN54763.1 transcriptional regulator, TetR family [Paenibacillus sp. OV219]